MIHKISMGHGQAGQALPLELAKYFNFAMKFILVVWMIGRGRDFVFHRFLWGVVVKSPTGGNLLKENRPGSCRGWWEGMTWGRFPRN